MNNDKFYIFKDEAAEWRWKRVAANGQIIAVSGEGYKNLSHCEKMVDRMREVDCFEVEVLDE